MQLTLSKGQIAGYFKTIVLKLGMPMWQKTGNM